MDFSYISGFGSFMTSEALPNALPVGQNSPKQCPYGLYAEQLSGSAFTAPRSKNLRSWLYRIRPSVQHSAFAPYVSKVATNVSHGITDISTYVVNPNQLRWSPRPLPTETSNEGGNPDVDFVDGLEAVGGAGDPSLKEGLCIYTYVANKSMTTSIVKTSSSSSSSVNDTQDDSPVRTYVQRAFSSSDGDLLIVPQEGSLLITTEFGKMTVAPCEIAVIQRGIKFSVDLPTQSAAQESTQSTSSTVRTARGYVLEIFKGHFELPSLGPIGANGLANPRDFLTPVAAFEIDPTDCRIKYQIINKFLGQLFTCTQHHSPYDVAAWHGNYAPYKYDLRNFCAMNSVTFDHPDPSIFTVLTCPSDEPGTAVADFVIFPPRWLVAEHTFRPPYFHRNCMSEYMGMIYGQYDAKEGSKGEEGFVPGGSSLHSCMTPHGPDSATFLKASASQAALTPVYLDSGLAFMFETTYMLKISPHAMSSTHLQDGYKECWREIPKVRDL